MVTKRIEKMQGPALQLMFETNTIGKGWDGMYRGKPQVMDAYTWTVEAIGDDGKHYKFAGNSALLR